MKAVTILGVFLVALASAQYDENYPAHYRHHKVEQDDDEHKDYHDEPNYKYEYKVEDHRTGDFKGQAETREGGTVKGYYMVKEADGTLREVHYTADDHNGFNAVVKRSGTPSAAPEHEHKAPQPHRQRQIHHPELYEGSVESHRFAYPENFQSHEEHQNSYYEK